MGAGRPCTAVLLLLESVPLRMASDAASQSVSSSAAAMSSSGARAGRRDATAVAVAGAGAAGAVAQSWCAGAGKRGALPPPAASCSLLWCRARASACAESGLAFLAHMCLPAVIAAHMVCPSIIPPRARGRQAGMALHGGAWHRRSRLGV